MSWYLQIIYYYVVLRYLLIFGSKTLIFKNSSCPLTQKLSAQMLILASSHVIADLYCSCSPGNGINFISTSTSLHISFNMFTVNSHISLWHIETNFLFLQLILCWVLHFEPHYMSLVSCLMANRTVSNIIPRLVCLIRNHIHLMDMHSANLKLLSLLPFCSIAFVLSFFVCLNHWRYETYYIIWHDLLFYCVFYRFKIIMNIRNCWRKINLLFKTSIKAICCLRFHFSNFR